LNSRWKSAVQYENRTTGNRQGLPHHHRTHLCTIIVNGEEAYAGFVNELNQCVEKYNTILAQHEGRNAKEEEK
jgi:hypothetical protein